MRLSDFNVLAGLPRSMRDVLLSYPNCFLPMAKQIFGPEVNVVDL